MWVHCLTQGDISASGFRLGSLSFSEPKKNTTFQSCPIPWDSMDHSSPDSSVHGILQARILKWVAIPFSREEGNKLSSATLQVDSLPSEPPGKPLGELDMC